LSFGFLGFAEGLCVPQYGVKPAEEKALIREMNRKFDSDQLSPCHCGYPTLTIEFFSNGDWRISCLGCGAYWSIKEPFTEQAPS
jgi:hypothetical protein